MDEKSNYFEIKFSTEEFNTFTSEFQENLLTQINRIREDPKCYLPYLKDILENKIITEKTEDNQTLTFYLSTNSLGEEMMIQLEDGIDSIVKAIEYINKKRPLNSLTFDEKLSLVAKEKVEEISIFNKIKKQVKKEDEINLNTAVSLSKRIDKYYEWNKQCSESLIYSLDTAKNIILNLLIDDGNISKRNRNNLFNEDSNFLGIGIAEDVLNGLNVSLVFVAELREKNTALYKKDYYKYVFPKISISSSTKNNYIEVENNNENRGKNILGSSIKSMTGRNGLEALIDYSVNSSLAIKQTKRDDKGHIIRCVKNIYTSIDEKNCFIREKEMI